jgi:glycosyltransferase involved in cell wall biosynthesis
MRLVEVDRSRPRRESAAQIRSALVSAQWSLVILEGTGIAGGLNAIRAAREGRIRYIVSSGDPIGGFFRTVRGRAVGAAFERYERTLYRNSAGFVGWSPYLTGMALKMGAPRGVTVEGGVDLRAYSVPSVEERAAARAALGIPSDHLVLGVVGSLTWTSRQQYCYGLELVEALRQLRRQDVTMLIVGDGDGRMQLERRTPAHLRDRVVLTGRIGADEVPTFLRAFDVGFVTQTLDGLGSYRLTTKLPEYMAAGVPVAMSPVPGYFDYVADAGWALPEGHPASPSFHDRLAKWIDGLTREDVEERRAPARRAAETRFDYEQLSRRFAAFVTHVIAQERR